MKNKQQELNIYSKIFLGGKSLKELNFPDDWEYDFFMCRWKSEKHYIIITPGVSRNKKTDSPWGKPYKQYLYITDEMLAEMEMKNKPLKKSKNYEKRKSTKLGKRI